MKPSPNTPSLQAQATFYDTYWAKSQPFSDYKLQRVQLILGYLREVRKECPNPRILDYGCGDGRSVAVWSLVGSAAGFDLSDDAMKAAAAAFPLLEFQSGDACAENYSSESFDVVISQEVIEHIIDQRAYLEQCSRLLAPGGFLILTTPNKYFFDRVQGGNYSRQPIENTLNPQDLRALVEEHFVVRHFTSMVYASAHFGVYRALTNRWLISLLRRLGLRTAWMRLLGRRLLLLNLVIVARRR